jgi:hypothetical protein
MVCLASTFFIAGCDTDIEPVDINEPGIQNQNPELYEEYLTNLRQYKTRDHKMVFGWFDNSAKTPASQGQNILAVPDSLDFLVLKSPGELNVRELQEMKDIKEKKGIRTLYEINFMTIKDAYDAAKEAFEESNKEETFKPDFNTFLVDTVNAKLDLCEQYGYEGVVMTFLAKTKIYMTKDEQAAAIALENDFLGIAKDWKERHADKMLVLAGKPQHVEDQSLLGLASYIIIPCEDAVNAEGMIYNFSKATVEGVPAEKFIALVSLYSQDPNDMKTGYWGKEYAATGAARFCATEHPGFHVAGLALKDINTDYYHVNFVYPVVRKAISIINPTVKH